MLDALRVPWRDRGSNCSRGHVNVKCPWCGNQDPSQHLTIKEETGEYYCFRAPQLHSGKSLPWLLLGLGQRPAQIDGIIHEFSDGRNEREPRFFTAVTHTPVRWERFEPAYNFTPALDYLRERGFHRPDVLSRDFDLRFTRTGRMAWRILLPLSTGGDVTGCVGRGIRTGQTPRYLTDDPFEGSVYIPSYSETTELLMFLEGPIDALVAAVDNDPAEVMPVGILGLALPPERLMTISNLARGAKRAVFVQDADQPASAAYRLIDQLLQIPWLSSVERAEPPPRRKDVGELAGHRGELKTWLDTLRSGEESSRTTRASRLGRTTGAYGTS